MNSLRNGLSRSLVALSPSQKSRKPSNQSSQQKVWFSGNIMAAYSCADVARSSTVSRPKSLATRLLAGTLNTACSRSSGVPSALLMST